MTPLMRRVPRQLKNNFGKYLGMFALIAFAVAFIAGCLNGASSISRLMDELPDKYHLEDGRVIVASPLTDTQIEAAQQGEFSWYDRLALAASGEDADLDDYRQLSLYPLFSHDVVATVPDDPIETSHDITMRLYTMRDQIDLPALHEGRLPETANEIAIDPTFARNHGIDPGDEIEVGERTLTVTGIVSLPDYTTLFQKNTDFIMDDLTFCVGVMTQEGYARFDDLAETYTYGYTFDDPDLTLAERTAAESDLAKALLLADANVTDLIDIESNQGYSFAIDDTTQDSAMYRTFFFVIVAVMAFIFVVITGATIEEESPVIGTLLASGYRRGELLRHYLVLPMLVSVVAVIVGTACQGVFTAWARDAYYSSYSLPPFVFHADRRVFVETTCIPVILLFVITLVGLAHKLKYTPLAFLRHEATRTRRGKGVRLPQRLPFLTRFRLRVLLNNVGSIVTIFFGIFISGTLLLMGVGMLPLIQDFTDELAASVPAEHIYMLRGERELSDEDAAAADQAEKVELASLKMNRLFGDKQITLNVYGIEPNSRYWRDVDVSGGNVAIGAGLARKAGLDVGDTLRLYDPYHDKQYETTVTSIAGKPTDLNVYMGRGTLNDLLGNDTDAFNGWVSDEELHFRATDIQSDLTPAAMTKIAEQMQVSMGDIMSVLTLAAVVIFVIMMYLLSKTVMERSARAISQLKVFGYRDREVSSIYVHAITASVIVAVLVSIPVLMQSLKPLVELMMMDYDIEFALELPWDVYARYVMLTVGSYAAVAVANRLHLKRVPLALALKTQG